ncbi:hypothetical protein D5S17_33125 [Pseudonocardiaceae bacterium YIM PH 21723]|nr:hypothetical protein D5S17_33125 [Pseudonocardiaceae bacterium YIM PH 21723]
MNQASAADRLRLAIEMFDFGLSMQRSRLHRMNPGADDAVIDTAVQDWLLSRPWAPLGKAMGRSSSRFA